MIYGDLIELYPCQGTMGGNNGYVYHEMYLNTLRQQCFWLSLSIIYNINRSRLFMSHDDAIEKVKEYHLSEYPYKLG